MLIKANGIRVNYELSGKKGAPVVMLSHSLGSSLAMWDPQMDSLRSYFQVLRYDIRGHGGSEGPAGTYTLEILGDDAIGLLDALNINRIHWVGLSMGGMIGQRAALNHPNRLMSLALCDTAAVMPKESLSALRERIDTARVKGMSALVEPTIERWFTPSFLKRNSSILGLIRKQLLATSVEGYTGCSEAIGKLDHLDRLTEIQLPTLIIVGEEDPGTPVAAAEAMHERIRHSKLVIIPSARHLSNVEQPELFTRALLDFLGAL